MEKFAGDAVMAVFGVPRVREDDALRAVRAAVEIRELSPALSREVGVRLRFRTGVNTGLVVIGAGETLVTGDAVNVAARLEQAAAPGEIVLGADTFALVRGAVQVEPLEPLGLKGKSEPVAAYRLMRLDPVAPGVARRLDRPLVARERELRLLKDAWRRALDDRGCHLFTLLGTAGVGKSRLVLELLADVADAATVLRGRCLHYGEGITFFPLIEAVTEVGEEADVVLERLRRGSAAVPQELFWEVQRLLEALAQKRPLIVCIDDLQWAEPMLLDLLDHVVEFSRGAAILLLCAARPELLERRPTWGGGKVNASTVLLEPLSAAASELLLDQLGDALDRETRSRVIAASEGNPLFLEEMVALVSHRGRVAVPATIHALLSARLELLALEEREVLERGAVEGEVFHREGLRALVGEPLARDVELRLAGLVRKDLIRPHRRTLPEDEAFRFRHLLIRDTAYEELPKATRAELHERFATWLEQTGRELLELDEIAGWHLEQAVRYQLELGRETDRRMARRAAEHLHAGGRQAAQRGDVTAARNLLDRALALVPAGEALAGRVAVDLVQQLVDLGELRRADELLSMIEGDPDVALLASLDRLEWLYLVRPHEATQKIAAMLPEMLEQLVRAGDDRGLAKAHNVALWVHWSACQAAAASEQARLAAHHARAAGDEGLRARALSHYISTMILGQAPAAEIAQELDVIEREELGPYLAASLNRARAVLARFEGRFDAARQLIQRAMEDAAALGMRARAASYGLDLATIEFSAANPVGAQQALERADAALAELGERGFRSTVQAALAEAHELLDDPGAARAAIARTDELTAPDDVVNYMITHAVRARLALGEGDGLAAERWARSAIDYSLSTDWLWQQARARSTLGHVLTALDRSFEASVEFKAALDLYERKGDQPQAQQTRALLAQATVRS